MDSLAQVQNQQIKKRSACDRCHSQKLRCLKRTDVDGCIRCHKARATCIFSPSLRKFRSPDANDFGAPPVEMSGVPMPDIALGNADAFGGHQNLDQGFYNLEPSMNDIDIPSGDLMNLGWNSDMFAVSNPDASVRYEAIETQPSDNDSTPNLSSSTSSERLNDVFKRLPAQLSPSEIVMQEVNQLSSKLYTHADKFPQRDLPISQDGVTLHLSATPAESQYYNDTLFFTNCVIELYPRFIADVLSFSPKPICSLDMSIATPSISSGNLAIKIIPQLDYPSILQVNACHQRLTGCWDKLLNQMESCTKHMIEDMLQNGADISLGHIPNMLIGNYKPSKAQVMLMQQALLLQLLKQLWERSCDLLTTVQMYMEIQKSSVSLTATGSMARLTEGICIETKTMANANLDKLGRLKGLWEDRGLVYSLKT